VDFEDLAKCGEGGGYLGWGAVESDSHGGAFRGCDGEWVVPGGSGFVAGRWDAVYVACGVKIWTGLGLSRAWIGVGVLSGRPMRRPVRVGVVGGVGRRRLVSWFVGGAETAPHLRKVGVDLRVCLRR